MTKIEASKILRDKAIAWGMADKNYQPASWMIAAVIAAVSEERISCADTCMRATPDKAMKRAIGDAAHYVACSDAIKARSLQS